ncbi:MAG: enhanced serine sensitivity protein SseB C-terminal domain-containing protein [Burkholderiaceae bacterium]|nr:enhanced serine sensitivity protein SseB C-terminal domain-containing protein [Burkholderiaceae bacterium]
MNVKRAYLAQISSGDQSSVALCVRVKEAPDQDLVREVAAVFASIFPRQEYLDILFLSESQESALRRVCGAFFVAPMRGN